MNKARAPVMIHCWELAFQVQLGKHRERRIDFSVGAEIRSFQFHGHISDPFEASRTTSRPVDWCGSEVGHLFMKAAPRARAILMNGGKTLDLIPALHSSTFQPVMNSSSPLMIGFNQLNLERMNDQLHVRSSAPPGCSSLELRSVRSPGTGVLLSE